MTQTHSAQPFRLPGRARFDIGVADLCYQSPETDDATPFARRRMGTMVRGQATADALGIRP
jgi:hypothetical protein